MKLTIDTKTLKDALHRTAQIPGAAGAIMYTQLIRLKADFNGFNFVRFTNCAKIDITIEEDVEIEDEGELAVSHADLMKYVGTMPGAKILIFTNDTHLFMNSGNVKAKISIITTDTEVLPPEDELETESVNVPLEELRWWLDSVAPAMHKDETDELFFGVGIKEFEGKLSFLASNRKVFMARKTEYNMIADALVGVQSVEMILKVLEKRTGKGVLSLGESTIRITGNNIEVSAALQAKKFADIEKNVTPDVTSIKSKLKVHRAELSEGLRKLAAARDGVGAMHVRNNELQIVVGNSDSGMQLKLDAFVEGETSIGIIPDKLADFADFLNAEDGGLVSMDIYPGMIFVRQHDRLALAVLVKTPDPS